MGEVAEQTQGHHHPLSTTTYGRFYSHSHNHFQIGLRWHVTSFINISFYVTGTQELIKI